MPELLLFVTIGKHIFAFAMQQMKKGVLILFASFYLLVSTGLTLDVHYCGGQLVDVEVLGTPDHCCSEVKKSCHKKDENKCCNDETVLVQLDQWQIISNISTLDVGPAHVPKINRDYEQIEVFKESQHDVFKDLPPPKVQPLWLLYRSLTFYG